MSTDRFFSYLRFPGLMLVIVLGLVLAVGSGGGGGGGGDDEDGVGILEIYSFQIGGELAGGGFSEISVETGDLNLLVTPDVRGSLLCDPVTEACALQTVSEETRAEISDESGSPDPLDLIAQVQGVPGLSGIWVFDPVGSDYPSTGRITIDTPPLDGSDLIAVEVIGDCEGGGPGVEVTPSVGDAFCFTWDAFESLLDTSEDPVELAAALGWNAITFTLEQASYSLEIFPYLDDEWFSGVSLLVIGCDDYAGPSAGAVPGDTSIEWLDDNPDGSVGPGDSFQQVFTSCWIDDPADDIDTLLNGTIDFVGYTEVVDSTREVITRIGFEDPPLGTAKIGGVGYTDMTIIETEEDGAGGYIEDTPVVLNGVYRIVFFE